MKPYQERVVKEEQDLAKKCEALVDFTESNPDFKTLTDSFIIFSGERACSKIKSRITKSK